MVYFKPEYIEVTFLNWFIYMYITLIVSSVFHCSIYVGTFIFILNVLDMNFLNQLQIKNMT